jgi:aspartate/methionine/tyrosine aminotransferase
MVRFSRRVPSDLRPNRLAVRRTRLGPPAFDLTESNPTRCDLPYPTELLQALLDPAGLRYDPEPRGLELARRAIARWYQQWEVRVDPQHVVLTASTSEAYSFLLKLLVDPGGTAIVPKPSYPLFGQLARLDGVGLAHYRLDPEVNWRVDPDTIGAAPGTSRAIVAVHPNNPTGSFVHPDDAELLTTRCRSWRAALVVDEVFLPYRLRDTPGSLTSFASNTRCLTFTLGGMSKALGLPQLKLAWIVVSGDESEVRSALDRLEYIADAYLSVSTPVALAAPELLRRCEVVCEAIGHRCRANLDRLLELARAVPHVAVLEPDGGWSAVLRIPNVIDEEDLAIDVLETHGVAVHPGFLFDFPSDGYLVVSLLPPEPVFTEGVRRLLDAVEHVVGGMVE